MLPENRERRCFTGTEDMQAGCSRDWQQRLEKSCRWLSKV